MPKAYASVGLLAGVGLTAVICVLTFISGSVIISLCADGRRPSYGALVRAEFGPTAGRWLQTSILVHVFGVMVVYLVSKILCTTGALPRFQALAAPCFACPLGVARERDRARTVLAQVIIADMLVGSAPDWHGLLPYLLSRHDGPWFLRRWAVTGGLVLTVVCPMLAARDLSVVSRFSRFSVALMLALAATLFGLAGVAVAGGQAGDVHVLPPPLAGGPLAHLSAALTVLAVLALAFTNQMNLVPIHNSLADGSTRNMLSVTRHAIALCALLYGALAVAGYTLFGSATEGDVLKNLTVRHVSTLVGRRPAEALVSFIVAANTANLLVNFVLKVCGGQGCAYVPPELPPLLGIPTLKSCCESQRHSERLADTSCFRPCPCPPPRPPADVGGARERDRAGARAARRDAGACAVGRAHGGPGGRHVRRVGGGAVGVVRGVAGGVHRLRHLCLRLPRHAAAQKVRVGAVAGGGRGRGGPGGADGGRGGVERAQRQRGPVSGGAGAPHLAAPAGSRQLWGSARGGANVFYNVFSIGMRVFVQTFDDSLQEINTCVSCSYSII
jgi:amino acid permease